MVKKRFFSSPILTFFLLMFVLPGSAFAAVTDLSSFGSVTNTMTSFLNDVNAVINAIFATSQLSDFVYNLWTFFTILLISKFVFDYIFGEVSLRGMFDLVLTIGVTKVLIDYYDNLTTAFWSWSIGFAEGVQFAAVGSTDLFFLPSYIFNLVKAMSFTDFNILTTTWAIMVASTLGLTLSLAVGVTAVFTATWSIWGYAVAKIIGWMFVPCLMFERLSWLFDGWLRFFFGFLLYNVIARVNLLLVALVLKGMMGAASISPGGAPPVQMVIDSTQDALGLICFLVIGLVAMISTGKFAMAIAGGTASGGGGLVRGAVKLVLKGLA